MSTQLVIDAPVFYFKESCYFSMELLKLVLKVPELKNLIRIAPLDRYPNLSVKVTPSLDPRDKTPIRQGIDCFQWILSYCRNIWGGSIESQDKILLFEEKVDSIIKQGNKNTKQKSPSKVEEIKTSARTKTGTRVRGKVPLKTVTTVPKLKPVQQEGAGRDFSDGGSEYGNAFKTDDSTKELKSKSRNERLPEEATEKDIMEARCTSLIKFENPKPLRVTQTRKKAISKTQEADESEEAVKSALRKKKETIGLQENKPKKRTTTRRVYGSLLND